MVLFSLWNVNVGTNIAMLHCMITSLHQNKIIYTEKCFWSLLIKLQSSFDFPGGKQFSFENFVAQTFHPLSLCFQNPWGPWKLLIISFWIIISIFLHCFNFHGVGTVFTDSSSSFVSIHMCSLVQQRTTTKYTW